MLYFCFSIYNRAWNQYYRTWNLTSFVGSIKQRKLYCEIYVGGGDSKMLFTVVNSMPYGGDIFIKKEEYRVHIAKCMSTDHLLKTILVNKVSLMLF